jgi:hypothetical protein
VTNFEDIGRTLDRELERLRQAAEHAVKPATCDKAAGVLRSISASLTRLAEQIESKAAPKKSP